MSAPLHKYTNVINPRTGRPVVDRQSGRPVSRRVQMTPEETAEFEAERAAQREGQSR